MYETKLEGVTNAREIYSVLSNADSLLIFELSANVIPTSRDVLEKYHLTKKRYYSRLKRLVKLGLVAKIRGTYSQTALGAMIYENQVKTLQRILTKKGDFEVLDDLRRRNKPDDGLFGAISDISNEVMKNSEYPVRLS